MAVRFFFGNTELSLELWTVIAGGGRGLMIRGDYRIVVPSFTMGGQYAISHLISP